MKPDKRVDPQLVAMYLAAGFPVPPRLLPSRVPGEERYEPERVVEEYEVPGSLHKSVAVVDPATGDRQITEVSHRFLREGLQP